MRVEEGSNNSVIGIWQPEHSFPLLVHCSIFTLQSQCDRKYVVLWLYLSLFLFLFRCPCLLLLQRRWGHRIWAEALLGSSFPGRNHLGGRRHSMSESWWSSGSSSRWHGSNYLRLCQIGNLRLFAYYSIEVVLTIESQYKRKEYVINQT